MEPILVITTCDKKEDAEMLAGSVLSRRLGACVQIYSGISSSYWWKGEIVQDSELVVSIKSCKENYQELEQVLLNIHPYDVPEIISLRIDEISPTYLLWMKEEMGINLK